MVTYGSPNRKQSGNRRLPGVFQLIARLIGVVCIFVSIPTKVLGNEAWMKTIPVTLGEKTIKAAVADTDSTRMIGLLTRDALEEDEGMLLDFVFAGNYAIHMQGMKFPIDAVWIDANGKIITIYENIMPNSGRVYGSIFSSRYCLELKAGFCSTYQIKEGLQVKIGHKAP
jgi:uncharacterized membrane protein (UPF0127 family)